jgi:hypothetical protein
MKRGGLKEGRDRLPFTCTLRAIYALCKLEAAYAQHQDKAKSPENPLFRELSGLFALVWVRGFEPPAS